MTGVMYPSYHHILIYRPEREKLTVVVENSLRGERPDCEGIGEDLYGSAGSAVLACGGHTSLRW